MERFHSFIISFIAVWGFCVATNAQDRTLAFSPDGKGFFHFNTGALKGFIRADGKTQGMNSLVDIESGQEIAHGGDYPGLFSFYRVFANGKRFGDAARDWPVEDQIVENGGLRLRWPASEENPFELVANYRWRSATVLDCEIEAIPKTDLKDFELFLSSYFNTKYTSWIYVRPTVHNGGEAQFVAADANPLLEGTYLAFPRDRQAAQKIFDGRWEMGHNPVDFAIPRFCALPIGMRKDPSSGLSVVLMARAEDCFAVETPYNMEPQDGIAGHASIYFSLFGYDLPAGKTAHARTRMMVGKNLQMAEILKEYEAMQ